MVSWSLIGSEDKLVPVSAAQNAHKLIKNSELYILFECAHAGLLINKN